MNAAGIICVLIVLMATFSACSKHDSTRTSDEIKSDRSLTVATRDRQHERVVVWLMKAPFDDPTRATDRNFTYDGWFDEGRAIPRSVEILIEMLEEEDLERPSGMGMRTAYALGWIGDGRKRAIDALLRGLDSKDVAFRVEAAAALGRLGDTSALSKLEELLTDEEEDINVRANACISIGRLGVPSSEKILRDTLNHSNPFLAKCAEEALRLFASPEP